MLCSLHTPKNIHLKSLCHIIFYFFNLAYREIFTPKLNVFHPLELNMANTIQSRDRNCRRSPNRSTSIATYPSRSRWYANFEIFNFLKIVNNTKNMINKKIKKLAKIIKNRVDSGRFDRFYPSWRCLGRILDDWVEFSTMNYLGVISFRYSIGEFCSGDNSAESLNHGMQKWEGFSKKTERVETLMHLLLCDCWSVCWALW